MKIKMKKGRPSSLGAVHSSRLQTVGYVGESNSMSQGPTREMLFQRAPLHFPNPQVPKLCSLGQGRGWSVARASSEALCWPCPLGSGEEGKLPHLPAGSWKGLLPEVKNQVCSFGKDYISELFLQLFPVTLPGGRIVVVVEGVTEGD